MENGIIKFHEEDLFLDVMDQYVIWRMKDIIALTVESKQDEQVNAAAKQILAYMTAPGDL
jgi:hypothetical protein